MRALVLYVLVAAVLLIPTTICAATWNYVYGGVDSPTKAGNDWTTSGNGTATWNLDVAGGGGGGGGGAKAIKLPWDDATPAKYKVYNKSLEANHTVFAYQLRFALVGGKGTAEVKPVFWRARWHDGRTRGIVRSDIGTGKDWADPDNPVPTAPTAFVPEPLAAWDANYHTYTVVMVDDAESNAGCYAYWDGQFAHYRQAALGSDVNDTNFGYIQAPPTGYLDAEFWLDYVAWGYEDTSDISSWGDPEVAGGLSTGVAATVLTDATANWTPGAFAGQRLAVGTPGMPTTGTNKFNEYVILTNDATTISIASGDMITDGVLINDTYRICRTTLGGLPTLDPDAAVPEPCSVLALGLGLLGVAGRLRRR